MTKETVEEQYDDEVLSALKDIVQHFNDEDKDVRDRQLRNWKKLKYYFDGITNLYQSGTAHDWRVWDTQIALGSPSDTGDSMYYDKNINIFKAYLESIIAALSITIPGVYAIPDDADNSDDLTTAKCSDRIMELVRRHQNLQLLWIQALFVYCTEGLICAYNYTDKSEKYGTYDEDQYESVEEEVDTQVCGVCDTKLADKEVSQELIYEFDPGEADVAIQSVLTEGKLVCPTCAELVDPVLKKEKILVDRFIGKNTQQKSRECVEVYGGLFVKVPNYAKDQKDIPYLTLNKEISIVEAIELFPELHEKWTKGQSIKPGNADDTENWARVSTQYRGSTPEGIVTYTRTWLRPRAFYHNSDTDLVKQLREEFPFGCKVSLINNEIVDICPEALDDHWTLTKNPLSDYLHHDPLGNVLVSIQDITRDLVSLTLQTIEHGIPQTFADPAVLNFKAYGQMESKPGMIYPAKPATGKSIGDGFYEIKTATLGGEVLPFSEKIQEAGQMVSGALPSLFGGAAPNSSKTAAQYAMSRAQALQRLQTVWKMLGSWWKDVFGKVIPSYIKCVLESGDEKFVKKNEDGSFINVLIRKSELQGKLGSVELETTEELPVSWAQKKEVIMTLLQMNNPMILDAITSPENLPALQEALGLPDFTLPGQGDREKQMEEIRELLAAEPIMNPQTGEEMPSVDIEPMVDNNPFEAEICKIFLKSDEGRLAKIENPAGYKNVLLHMMRHVNITKMMQAIEQPQGVGQQQQSGKPETEGQGPQNVSANDIAGSTETVN